MNGSDTPEPEVDYILKKSVLIKSGLSPEECDKLNPAMADALVTIELMKEKKDNKWKENMLRLLGGK